MYATYSDHSLGTIGTLGTFKTSIGSPTSRGRPTNNNEVKPLKYRCKFLWEGRLGKITLGLVSLPWNIWWQIFVVITIVYKYIVHFLLAYFLPPSEDWFILEITVDVLEIFFLVDVVVHILHAFWKPVKLYVRIYRRNLAVLLFDACTITPLAYLTYFNGFPRLVIIGRWLCISRIYRLRVFLRYYGNSMQLNTRKFVFLLEHMLYISLVLHGSTCLWFYLKKISRSNDKEWYNELGYPDNVGMAKLRFKCYLSCFYYCCCRLFNVVFGDSYPFSPLQKILTSALMLYGFVFLRFRFVGTIAWDYVVRNTRRLTYVETYHHMLSYLHLRGAPSALINQAEQYKRILWNMKDGVLYSDLLKKLPLPLQMELIYDINVGHFQKTILFRDCEEAFLRQISLLMRHEIFLAGQGIWDQGVVKNGMICIKHGVLELLSDEDDESPVIAFKAGTVLGELSLFYSIPAKVSVKAGTYVELQILRRTDFCRAMLEQPYLVRQIRHKVEKRLADVTQRQKAIIEYDRNDSRLIRTRYRPMKVFKDHLAGVEDEDSTFFDDSHMYYREKHYISLGGTSNCLPRIIEVLAYGSDVQTHTRPAIAYFPHLGNNFGTFSYYENNVRQPKFTKEYLGLYEISEKVTTIDKPKICLRSNFPWILEPDTDFTFCFEVIHFLMVLYVCTVTPYQVILSYETTDIERVVSTVVTCGLILNIYIQLTTAIFYKNKRIETVRDIAELKMSSIGFYLDILSVFPMAIFTSTLDPRSESSSGQLAALTPIVQVWHLWDYVSKWEKNFKQNVKFFALMKYGIVFVIFSYWAGCFLYLYACPRRMCKEDSWMGQQIYRETKVFLTLKPNHERPSYTSIAFGTAVFTGSGVSDILPGHDDLLLVIFMFILGAYIKMFYEAKICCLCIFFTRRKLKFKESMVELFYFLTMNHVPSKIRARVLKFFCVQWSYNKSVSTDELFKDMSSNIQQDVLSIDRVDTLLYSDLLKDCSHDFLQTLAANANMTVLPDNEVVQHAGDIGRDMYIIQKGYCKIINSSGKQIATNGPGSDFGMIEMLLGMPKIYTVVTCTNCALLHLEFSALTQSLSSFPDISHPIVTALQDHDVLKMAKKFEEEKPPATRFEAKTNKLTQEIKESFVIVAGKTERLAYLQAFQNLGIFRFVRYIMLPGCITPHGMFLKFWCALRFILAIYYIFLIPYNIAITSHKIYNDNNYVDIALYLDVVVMAYVAYYNEKSLLITHPLYTIKNYLRHGFLLDFIIVFPFELLLKKLYDNTNTDLCRLNKMLQIIRIVGAFFYFEDDILRMSQAMALLKFLPIVLTVVNLATALMMVKSCRSLIEDENKVFVNCTRVLLVKYQDKFEKTPASEEYLRTFFWVFEMFLGVGCTPVMITNTLDVTTAISLQIIGCLYFAFTYGYVASTTSSAAHALLDHNEKTLDLTNFLYQQNVDPVLTTKTLKYFEYVWKRTKGSNPQLICRRLNSALMEDTLVFMYEHTLREVPLFAKVDRSFIRVITQHLHEMYFLKDDTVIQSRDVQPYIFIIYRGKVDVMNSYNEMITCMGPGGMFGNFSGQPLACSKVAIYASRNLDVLVIPGQTFFNLVKYYPKVNEPLQRAFETSNDYILPISMDSNTDEGSSDESEEERHSFESNLDSKSGSASYTPDGQVSVRTSHSTVSRSKSYTSVITFQSYTDLSNLFKPGAYLYQLYGYTSCCVATLNYILLLYEIVTLNDCFIIVWLQAFFDIYFYIKLYFSLHEGYASGHGVVILDNARCRRKYYRQQWRLWTDIICNFPMEYFALLFNKPIRMMHYFRANKLFRLKYLLEFYKKTSAELTNNITTLQAVMTLLVVFLIIHTMSCIWLLIMFWKSPIYEIRTLKTMVVENENASFQWDFVSSIYIVLCYLTTTGGDEFTINTICIAVFFTCLAASKMLAATVVSSSIQISYSSKHALCNYEKEAKELLDVLSNQGLCSYQKQRYWKYVQQLWITERGRQLPALLEQTPYVRRCDLMSAMFGQHLRNCYLFTNTGEPFLRQLTVALVYTTFFPGNYIVVAGDTEARMYWVVSGTVGVVSVKSDLTETTHELLGPGDIFGILQGMHNGIRHWFSYRAETKVSILTLSLDSWIHILPFFPEAERILSERSEILFTMNLLKYT